MRVETPASDLLHLMKLLLAPKLYKRLCPGFIIDGPSLLADRDAIVFQSAGQHNNLRYRLAEVTLVIAFVFSR